MDNQKLIVCSFYKYVKINNVEKFKIKHQAFCKKLGIKGTILLGDEGINGSVSGYKDQIQKYKNEIKSIDEFSDVEFKDTVSEDVSFNKLIVKIKKEIVSLGKNPEISQKGRYLSPKEFNDFVEDKEIIIVDARNDYEHKIGKFENALTFNIKTFREFPNALPELKKYKNKKIVMYCTGGIRCEKASALLKEEGFNQVYQLEGGIINYINQYYESPDSKFKGRCFVFDERLSIPSGKNSGTISVCEMCHVPCGEYIRCMNTICDKLVIMCSECKEKMNNACSKACKNKLNIKAEKIVT